MGLIIYRWLDLWTIRRAWQRERTRDKLQPPQAVAMGTSDGVQFGIGRAIAEVVP